MTFGQSPNLQSFTLQNSQTGTFELRSDLQNFSGQNSLKKYPPFGGYFLFQIKCVEPATAGPSQISRRTSGTCRPRFMMEFLYILEISPVVVPLLFLGDQSSARELPQRHFYYVHRHQQNRNDHELEH